MNYDNLPSLIKPTIADMVEFLLTLPQEMPLRIRDADTEWTIETIHFDVDEKTLMLYGEYSEMSRDY